METIKIKIHSTVDIITNSSTVIFTYQGDSVEPVKELIDEILKLSGTKNEDGTQMKADDCFYFGVFLCDDDSYLEGDDCPEDMDDKSFEKLKLQILKGETERPDWMTNREEQDNEGYTDSTNLEIMAKDKKYSKLAEKLLGYLNSPTHEASYSG